MKVKTPTPIPSYCSYRPVNLEVLYILY